MIRKSAVLSRRAFLAGSLALIGCGGGKGSSTTGPTPGGGTTDQVVRAPSPIGYGSVHAWQVEEPERIVDLLAAHGLTLTQAEGTPPGGTQWGELPIDWSRLRRLADLCRAREVRLFFDLANWNGPEWHTISDAVWRDLLSRTLDTIGADAWLEGVSEPKGSRARALDQMALDFWPGQKVVNRGWDHGSAAGALQDWHFCNVHPEFIRVPGSYVLMEQMRQRPGQIFSTDCTPALASNITEREVKEATALAAQLRQILILYDTFQTPTNLSVIRWMQEALRRWNSGESMV